MSHPIDPVLLARRRRRPAAAPPRADLRPDGDRRRVGDRRTTWPGRPRRRCCAARTSRAAATAWAMDQIMSGEATPGADRRLRRGAAGQGRDAPTRWPGWSDAMLDARRIGSTCRVRRSTSCGTGGDRAHTVNISTMAGDRRGRRRRRGWSSTATGPRPRPAAPPTCSRSSASTLDLTPDAGGRVSAPRPASPSASRRCFHPACGTPAAARGELGVPTVFNFLGPLTNPAQPAAQAVGCADARMAGVMADVFAGRGALGAGVPRRRRPGRADDHDARRSVWVVRDGAVEPSTCSTRASSGIAPATPEALRGGDARVQRRAWPGGCSPARRARSATPCCSTRRRRWSRCDAR